MTTMPIWISGLVLLAFAYMGMIVFMLFRQRGAAQKAYMAKRLEGVARAESPETAISLVKDRRLSTFSWLNVMLAKGQWAVELGKMLKQARMNISLGAFILLSLLLGLSGWKAADMLGLGPLPSGACMLGLIPVPFLWARLKRAKRLANLELQLPDAMDLIARALRAGHTFISGLQLVQQEFKEPIQGEIASTLDEITFGVDLQDALDNLMARVPSNDLRFFVVSIKIQNETGGNLAEVVETIARIIRERFKLRNQIQSLSAEGRLSAVVLCLLPFLIFGIISRVNPEYMSLLYTHTLGKTFFYVAIFLMVVGIFVMRRMIRIKV